MTFQIIEMCDSHRPNEKSFCSKPYNIFSDSNLISFCMHQVLISISYNSVYLGSNSFANQVHELSHYASTGILRTRP